MGKGKVTIYSGINSHVRTIHEKSMTLGVGSMIYDDFDFNIYTPNKLYVGVKQETRNASCAFEYTTAKITTTTTTTTTTACVPTRADIKGVDWNYVPRNGETSCSYLFT